MKKLISLTLLSLPLALGIGLGFGFKNNAVPVRADDGQITETVESITDKAEEEIKNFKDTFLVPLLSGVSVTSVISALVAITLSFVNRKTNGKIKEATTNAIAKSVEISNAALQMIEQLKEMYQKLQDIKVELEQKGELINKDFAQMKGEVEKLYELKSEILKLAKVQATAISHDANLVAIGVAEEINKIVEEVKEIK